MMYGRLCVAGRGAPRRAPNAFRRYAAVPHGLSSVSLTNLRMRLCTRSSTTRRERSTRRTCRPWPRPPPRTAQRSTSFPSQRSPCPSPNNLADPVRTRGRRRPLCETHVHVPPPSRPCRTLHPRQWGPAPAVGDPFTPTSDSAFPPPLRLHSGAFVIRANQERRRSDVQPAKNRRLASNRPGRTKCLPA